MRTYRPRLLISGAAGMGQAYLGPAILHHLEGFHVQNLDLGVLLGDSGRVSSPIHDCVNGSLELTPRHPKLPSSSCLSKPSDISPVSFTCLIFLRGRQRFPTLLEQRSSRSWTVCSRPSQCCCWVWSKMKRSVQRCEVGLAGVEKGMWSCRSRQRYVVTLSFMSSGVDRLPMSIRGSIVVRC